MGELMKFSNRSACDRGGRRKYLCSQECKRFLGEAVNLEKLDALFCLTLYYTGCRISEALNLRGSEIDLETNTVSIQSLKKRGKHEVRRVPIPKFLAEELTKVIDFQSDSRIWQFSRTTGWRIIKQAMRKAQIAGIQATCKGLRHGFGVRGALGQIPLSIVQRWMGHADPSTTAIYLEVQGEEERTLIERTWK